MISRMSYLGLFVAVSLVALAVAGCGPKPVPFPVDTTVKDYSKPLPPGQLALRKITNPADLPNVAPACNNLAMLRESIDNSLRYMAKPSSKQFFPYGDISHEHAVASLQAFRDMLDSGLKGDALAAAIKDKFDVYISVGWDGKGGVKFTGYFTPIFNASATRTEQFRYPLYSAPDGLMKDAAGNILGVKGADGQVKPMPDRRQIEQSGMMAGKELVWMADPFEVYIAHVQGSARLKMTDGQEMIVGYTANNGYQYVSAAQELVKDGKIPAGEISLQAMIKYFKQHPDQVNSYIWRNPRFVFFARTDGGPFGSLNEPVTPWRTIATDKAIYPRACLAMVDATLPRRVSSGIQELPYKGFALDQDTGGAIRAPGRCDIYMGVGDQAGELAGRTQQEGRLYYFFLKTPPAPGSVVNGGDQPAPAPAPK